MTKMFEPATLVDFFRRLYLQKIYLKRKPYGEIGLDYYLKLQQLEFEENQYYLGQQTKDEVDFVKAIMDYNKRFGELFYPRFIEQYEALLAAKNSGELERIIIEKDKKALHAIIGEIETVH